MFKRSPAADIVLAQLTIVGVALMAISGCNKAETPTTALSPAVPSPTAAEQGPYKLTAGIQDLMAGMIDPSADFLWDSVSTTVSVSGVEEKQPRSDEEWAEVRRHAIILTEAANLLMIPGRHVAKEGQQLEDHGVSGNLTAEQAEQAIAADRATFIAFSQALHDAGAAMLKAADDRNPQGLIDSGETLDHVCESCHLKFWYPGQYIPALPRQAPENK